MEGILATTVSGGMGWMVAAIVLFGLAAVILGWCGYQLRERWWIWRSQMALVDDMSGEQFERLLEGLFRRLGARKVRRIGGSGDYGADILMEWKGTYWSVQAKRWSKPSGVGAVQEVIGAKSYYRTRSAMVVATHGFTKSARALAEKAGVELWDRDRLARELGRLRGRQASPKPTPPPDTPRP